MKKIIYKEDNECEVIDIPVMYEDIKNANETIKTTDIKGKNYAEVNQRIKAFRMVYPTGTIETNMISNENGIVIFRADIYNENNRLLATGTAYEKENSTFINKTSYIENCETSAIGRALGIAGFGIDTSVSSAEEVQNAINNQVTIETEEDAKGLVINFGKYNGKTLGEIKDMNDIKYLEYLFDKSNDENIKKAVSILTGLVEKTAEESKKEINAMPIQETQKQRLKDEYKDNLDQLQLEIASLGKIKLSQLTYEEANKLLKKAEFMEITEDAMSSINEVLESGDR